MKESEKWEHDRNEEGRVTTSRADIKWPKVFDMQVKSVTDVKLAQSFQRCMMGLRCAVCKGRH